MADPLTFAGPAAISAGSIIKVLQFGFAYNEVPEDVQAFQISIETFSDTLNSAKKLRRVKSHLLDDTEKREIDRSIQNAIGVLNDIGASIEACRKDLSTSGTVSVRNRVLWLLRDHRTFTSKTHTLDICHQKLGYEIIGMRQLQDSHHPQARDNSCFEGSLRPPSRRRFIPASGQHNIPRHESQHDLTWDCRGSSFNTSLDHEDILRIDRSMHDPPHKVSGWMRHNSDSLVTADSMVNQLAPRLKDSRYSDPEMFAPDWGSTRLSDSGQTRYSGNESAVSVGRFSLKLLDPEQADYLDSESPFADHRVGSPLDPRQPRYSGSISNFSEYAVGSPPSEGRGPRFSDSASTISDYTLVDTPPLTPSCTRESNRTRLAMDDHPPATSPLSKRRARKSLMIT